MQPKPSNTGRLVRKPALGLLSLALSVLAPLLTWVSVTSRGSDEWGGIFTVLVAMVASGLMWFLSFVAGIAGLERSEQPRWPAITGLSLVVATFLAFIVVSTYTRQPDLIDPRFEMVPISNGG